MSLARRKVILEEEQSIRAAKDSLKEVIALTQGKRTVTDPMAEALVKMFGVAIERFKISITVYKLTLEELRDVQAKQGKPLHKAVLSVDALERKLAALKELEL